MKLFKRNTQRKSRKQWKKEYDEFMLKVLFSDINTVIDCIGWTFKDWVKDEKKRIRKEQIE